MGYEHIENLYQNQYILLFKECYALEKIHGTSAHISWKHNQQKVILFSGGEKHTKFKLLFNVEKLKNKFVELFSCDVTIFGEAYGGTQQSMKDTYGDKLKFIVVDVQIDGYWLNVPDAEDVAKKFNLEFVYYKKITANLPEIDNERDAPSKQAERNGIEKDKIREGVVLRPIEEMIRKNGSRIISKHKRQEFGETKTKREVSPEQLKIMKDARLIAEEWVTPMRLTHVLDKLNNPRDITKTGEIIKAMIEDILREGKDEIKESSTLPKEIGRKTAILYKILLNDEINRG